MSRYLADVAKGTPLYVWRRDKKEFVIIPTSLIDEEDIESLQSIHLAWLIAERRAQETISLEEMEKEFDL